MQIIAIAVSTGGPGALREFFHRLGRLDACILLVQHMPRFINQSICRTLDAATAMDVRLAEPDDTLEPGRVLVAPSDVHMGVQDNRRIRLQPGPKVNYVRPAADVMFHSLIARGGDELIAVVMTGLGRDGAAGLAHVKQIGGVTYAQDEATSTIYGMPGSAVATGQVDYEGTPGAIRHDIARRVGLIHTTNALA
jgi:two-component system chemotaxis response regulator CheB